MPLPIFTPPITPSPGLSDKPEVSVWETDFGDGYSQTTRAGMNHIRSVISLTWDVLAPEEADAILAFLEERGGDQAFEYTVPGNAEPMRFTCKDWSSTKISGGYSSISATFRQSFNLVAA